MARSLMWVLVVALGVLAGCDRTPGLVVLCVEQCAEPDLPACAEENDSFNADGFMADDDFGAGADSQTCSSSVEHCTKVCKRSFKELQRVSEVSKLRKHRHLEVELTGVPDFPRELRVNLLHAETNPGMLNGLY